MGIIRKQSIHNSIGLYIGVFIGAVNTILIYPFVFESNPEYWGLLQLLVSYSIVISSFSHLGSPYILIRYFPKFKNKDDLITFLFVLCLFGFILFSSSFFLFKDYLLSIFDFSPLFSEYFYLIVGFVFSLMFFDLFNSVSRSYLDSTTPIFLNEVYLRVATLLILVAYHFSLINFSNFLWLYLIAFASKLVFLFIIQLYRKQISFSFKWSGVYLNQIRYGLYVILGNGAAILVSRIDMIMIEYFLDLKYVAYYGLAFFIGSVIKVPGRSLSSISTPLISKAFKDNNINEIVQIYKKTAINLLVISSLMFLIIWLNIDEILSILPEKFQQGKYVVLYIGLSQLIILSSGLNGLIIINSKFFRKDILFNFILLAFIVLTNILFIPIYGIEGAALASLISILLHNVIKIVFLYSKMKIQPFSTQTIKVLFLSIGIYLLFQWIPTFDIIILSILFKSVLILLIFIPLLIFMNISSDINDIYNILKRRLYELLR